MEILELKITMTEIRNLMDFTTEQALLKRELVNEHKLEENIQNDVETTKQWDYRREETEDILRYDIGNQCPDGKEKENKQYFKRIENFTKLIRYQTTDIRAPNRTKQKPRDNTL